eukprot:scaffold9103_cov124-Isochrysis_galbana.AAC.5
MCEIPEGKGAFSAPPRWRVGTPQGWVIGGEGVSNAFFSVSNAFFSRRRHRAQPCAVQRGGGGRRLEAVVEQALSLRRPLATAPRPYDAYS